MSLRDCVSVQHELTLFIIIIMNNYYITHTHTHTHSGSGWFRDYS